MKAKTKILLILWTIRIITYLFFIGVLFTYAWFIDRVIPCCALLTGYTGLRWCFPTTWHAKKTLSCICYSIIIFCVCTTLCLPIGMSLLWSVVVAMVLTYLLYKYQKLCDMAVTKATNKDELYAMSEEELRIFAKSKGLSEMIVDTLVLKVIHNYRWCEIQKERNYTKTGIDYHKEAIKKKLNIKL